MLPASSSNELKPADTNVTQIRPNSSDLDRGVISDDDDDDDAQGLATGVELYVNSGMFIRRSYQYL